jgi:hypothetical protein
MVFVTLKGFDPSVPRALITTEARHLISEAGIGIPDEDLVIEMSFDFIDGVILPCFVTHFTRGGNDHPLEDRGSCQRLANALGPWLDEKRKEFDAVGNRAWVEVHVIPTPVGPRGFYTSRPGADSRPG